MKTLKWFVFGFIFGWVMVMFLGGCASTQHNYETHGHPNNSNAYPVYNETDILNLLKDIKGSVTFEQLAEEGSN